MNRFPPAVFGWGTDTLVSALTVKIEDHQTGENEEIQLTSILEVSRSSPYQKEDGRSAIDLRLVRWSAKGQSQLLGTTIEYHVRGDILQPQSLVTSNQADSDFPATINFETISDTYVGDEKISSEAPGHAICRDAMTVPPLGSDVFEINKALPYADGRYTITAVACKSCRLLLSGPQRAMLKLGRMFRVLPNDFVAAALGR